MYDRNPMPERRIPSPGNRDACLATALLVFRRDIETELFRQAFNITDISCLECLLSLTFLTSFFLLFLLYFLIMKLLYALVFIRGIRKQFALHSSLNSFFGAKISLHLFDSYIDLWINLSPLLALHLQKAFFLHSN